MKGDKNVADEPEAIATWVKEFKDWVRMNIQSWNAQTPALRRAAFPGLPESEYEEDK